ncbi:MAG: GNAT family N-acetyltransferase [Ruminococcus sp.]|jgi:GNAT superfamily N-acetyltransferase|nr:GNAT family N-acetyltransferase [Ruminococcus sp.]
MHPLEIREAAPADTERIMRLVYRQYGKLNYDRTLYDAQKLSAEIAAGRYRYWLATYGGEDAGLVCLKAHPHFAGTYEGCTLSVVPEFRRLGIAKKLSDTMQSSFNTVRASSIFYSILTLRVLEEEREYENGCKPTGFALDRYLFDKSAQNLGGGEPLPKRRHHLFLVLPIDKKETAKLFIPPPLEGFVRRIYDDLNVAIGEKQTTPPQGEFVNFPESEYAEVYGAMPDGFKIADSTAVNLFLDMTDPKTPENFRRLREGGWRFTGIKPLQETAEYIIMHKGDINAGLDASVTLSAFESPKREIRRLANE